jgi:hypothetical protein
MLVKLPPVIVKLEEPVKNDMAHSLEVLKLWTQQKVKEGRSNNVIIHSLDRLY